MPSYFAVNSIKSVFLSEIGSGHQNSNFVESFKWAGGMPNIWNEWVKRWDHQRGGIGREFTEADLENELSQLFAHVCK